MNGQTLPLREALLQSEFRERAQCLGLAGSD
jgi:hypothetical protein